MAIVQVGLQTFDPCDGKSYPLAHEAQTLFDKQYAQFATLHEIDDGTHWAVNKLETGNISSELTDKNPWDKVYPEAHCWHIKFAPHDTQLGIFEQSVLIQVPNGLRTLPLLHWEQKLLKE